MKYTVCKVFIGVTALFSSLPRGVQSFQTHSAFSDQWASVPESLIGVAQDSAPVAEVVGAGGRIGSFILNQVEILGHGKKNGRVVAVPRNGSIGAATEVGKPIFVAVPATEIHNGKECEITSHPSLRYFYLRFTKPDDLGFSFLSYREDGG